jgi:hypothetical protein
VRIVDAGTVAFSVKGVTAIYGHLRECERCARCLPDRLFTQQPSVCDTCHRRGRHPTFRSAVGRVVEEHGIATSETDSDLHVFMDEHENDITQILEEAVRRHG